MYRWLRNLLGDRGEDYPDPPARLIDVYSSREPSPNLMRNLRAMDVRAEVVYVGQGRWWVGRVKPASPRRVAGRRLALRVREGDGFSWTEDGYGSGNRWPELRQGLLMAQGFGLLVDERIQGEPDARLVYEFTRALHYERTGYLEETEEERVFREVKADKEREDRNMERELGKWAFRRMGRRKSWVGGGSNEKRRRAI